MNRMLTLLILLVHYLDANSGIFVRFSVSDGVDNIEIKAKIETKVTQILTEINTAYMENRSLDYSKTDVNQRVQQSLIMLWEKLPFKCTDEEIIGNCIATDSGYQIRSIPLLMEPIEVKDSTEEYQEAVINFDKQGNVESFYLSAPSDFSGRIVRTDLDSTDLKHRDYILSFIEQLRTAYNQKDIKFIEHFFNDNSLYITSEGITNKQDSVKSQKKLYNKQTKEQFLKKLGSYFQLNEKVKFDICDIEVMRHPSNPNYYGLTLQMEYSSGSYHDVGYFFQLWDFTDEKVPQIHVCTWQPAVINGKPLPKDEVFSIEDFDI